MSEIIKVFSSVMTTMLSISGWFLIVFGGFGFIGISFDTTIDSETLTAGLILTSIMAIGGVGLLRKAAKKRKNAKKYRMYIDIVVNQDIHSIDSIAEAVDLPCEAVKKDLQEMIDMGYFKNAYINHGNREISLKKREAPKQAVAQTKTTRCPGCGANNVVTTGMTTECEYCGTKIVA